MKDIKKLYQTAKSSGRANDISAYVEAVNECLHDNPNDYIMQLEYIIQSDVGLKTFKEFVSNYGLPISEYDRVHEIFEKCIHKCEVQEKDDTAYKEAVAWLESYREKYIDCFMMYERYTDEVEPKYVPTYYSLNENGIQGRKLAAGMINAFGERAIPDAIITAQEMDNIGLSSLLEYLGSKYGNDSTFCEWICTVCDGVDKNDRLQKALKPYQENSLTTKTNAAVRRHQQAFREAVIMDDVSKYTKYTEEEVKTLEDMIAFKEYCITWADERNTNLKESSNQIHSLYEELSQELEEDTSDSVMPMLPNANGDMEEGAPWVVNTRDKKTGGVPTYLGRNHDMANYGEDDDEGDVVKSDDDSDQMTMDDYKRPSAAKDDSSDDDSDLPDEDLTGNDSDDEDSPKSSKSNGSVNNYYYYTYHNSMNKNSNSYNKTHSTSDDHSFISNDDHSTNTKTSDDHSTGKQVNSHNRNHSHNNGANDEGDMEESSPEGDQEGETITEAVGDADDGRPQSDHPVKDVLTDIDRKTVKGQQEVKKKVQDLQNVGRAAMKPVNRTKGWINNMISNWKDADETNIKEKLADPHARSNLFSAVKKSIEIGALYKAGLLLNPCFLFLTVTRGIGKNKREFRIRNEMIGELKTEREIIKEKISDADRKGDNKAKYQLMRLDNEINKKLMRVGGGKRWAKIL